MKTMLVLLLLSNPAIAQQLQPQVGQLQTKITACNAKLKVLDDALSAVEDGDDKDPNKLKAAQVVYDEQNKLCDVLLLQYLQLKKDCTTCDFSDQNPVVADEQGTFKVVPKAMPQDTTRTNVGPKNGKVLK